MGLVQDHGRVAMGAELPAETLPEPFPGPSGREKVTGHQEGHKADEGKEPEALAKGDGGLREGHGLRRFLVLGVGLGLRDSRRRLNGNQWLRMSQGNSLWLTLRPRVDKVSRMA